MSSSTQFISGISATDGAQVVAGTVNGSVYFGDDEKSGCKERRERLLRSLPSAVEAPFNTYTKQHEPTCLPDTRVDLLQEIYAWADGDDKALIFWLSGLAGTGKSTIARTVARKYFESGHLGASFFFSRGGGDVGHAGRFFTSIAVQLAKKSESLREYICDALEKNDDIATQSLADQWRQLALGPLSKLSGDSHSLLYIVVIDALDECDNDQEIQTILQLLTEAQSLETVRLRVFLTSRPEVPIRLGFGHVPEAEHQDFILHNILPSVVDQDLTIYLEHNLRLIRQKYCLDAGWPGEEVIRCLVQNASGLFIWAATACRFIWEGKRFATRRLAMILEGGSHAIKAPEKHLNEIYLTVLRQSVSSDYSSEEREELYGLLRYILGSAVILSSPLSPYSLSKLLHISKEEVDQTVDDLHAILEVSEDQTRPLRLHHPSFRDFLLSKDRCTDANLWVDEKQAHQRLSSRCIKLLSASLRPDICDVNLPGTMTTEVESSRVQQCLPPEVQYACLYWVHHLLRSGNQIQDDDDVERFLQCHFLHWLEALGWMHKISEGIVDIISLASITPANTSPSLSMFVQNMKRFVLHNRSAIEQAPLQVYCSALLFAPQMSLVRKQFTYMIPQWIKRVPDVEENWSATLHVLEGHSKDVRAIVFSTDGKQLASGSDDATVRVWDMATGTMLQILQGHSYGVTAIAFAPGGKQLASGSIDNTVRLWDAATGAILHMLLGHSECINAVAFSPDGKQLASGSYDTTVRVWDTSTGAMLRILRDHTDEVCSVAFSPDNMQLASGSWDGIVQVWDAATGATLWILECDSDLVYNVVYSPNSKQLVSCSSGGTLRVWDAATGAMQQIIEVPRDNVQAVVFLPDCKRIAFASNHATLRVRDAATGAALQMLEVHLDQAYTLAFSPEGKYVASADKIVRVWDTTMDAALPVVVGHSERVNVVAFSSDGKRAASGSRDSTVRLWDPATRKTLRVFKGHLDVVALAFSSNNKVLASCWLDDAVRVWNTVTGAMLGTFNTHMISAVALSPDGTKLAWASIDYTVWVRDIATGETLQCFATSNVVKTLSYSHDGLTLKDSKGLDVTASLVDDRVCSVFLEETFRESSQPANSPSRISECPILSQSANTTPRISVKNEWLLHGENRLLRLHPDYWPTCSAVYKNVVCMGHSSGHVAFFEFSLPP